MATDNSSVTRDTQPGRGSPRRRGGRGARAAAAGLAGGAVAVLLAACASAGGSTGSASTGTGAGTGQQTASQHGAVVAVRSLPGIGTVLVGRSGKTLYSPQQEAHGKIVCTGSCLSFWFPVSVPAGAKLGHPGGITGLLGTIHRPDDGLTQLTVNGMPLYTFRLDRAAGQANGNGFTDHFGGATITWHAITSGGTAATAGQGGGSGGGSGGGYGSGY
jgi:predicted lipoprotein with Yx(FWY)xxD motif